MTAGHTAIVTGANHGIGAATARALARRGCAGWLADTFAATTADRLGRTLQPVIAATWTQQFAIDAMGAALMISEFARRHIARHAAFASWHPHDGRSDWLVPPLLQTAEYAFIAAIGFAGRVWPPLTYGDGRRRRPAPAGPGLPGARWPSGRRRPQRSRLGGAHVHRGSRRCCRRRAWCLRATRHLPVVSARQGLGGRLVGQAVSWARPGDLGAPADR
jgi:hypothetical protein